MPMTPKAWALFCIVVFGQSKAFSQQQDGPALSLCRRLSTPLNDDTIAMKSGAESCKKQLMLIQKD